jgi:hypothetical protein
LQLVPRQRRHCVDHQQRARAVNEARNLLQRLVRARRLLGVDDADPLRARVRRERRRHRARLDGLPPRHVEQMHRRAVAVGHVRHARAERARDADDHLVSSLGQVGDARLHAGAPRPGHRERQLVLGLEHALQKAARLVHDLQVLRIQVAERRRRKRREHTGWNLTRSRPEQDAGVRTFAPGAGRWCRQWVLAPCRISSACRCAISTSRRPTPSLIDTAAAGALVDGIHRPGRL